MSTVDSVRRRLWAKAQYRAAEMGFAPHCKDLVKNIIKDAVFRIESEEALSDPDRIAVAEANIERFVSEMILAAKSRGDTELHEGSFGAAMGKLCPLWPFC